MSESAVLTHHSTYHSSLLLRIRMQTRQQVAHAQVSKDDQKESYHGKISGLSSVPAVRDARVQECSVGEPGDERAGLFGIPSPVSSPRFVCPDSARHQKKREA